MALLLRGTLFLVLALYPLSITAQVIPPSEQLGRERDRFTQPPAPRAQPGGPAITLPGTVAPPGAAETKVFIRDIRITGSTVYGPEELRSLATDLIGRSGTLQDVYEIARRITSHYGEAGYVLSRAIVPPQELNPAGAIVQIQVIEGYIDRVEWPASVSRFRDFFSQYSEKITAERPANIRTVERYILLASDLPGLKFSTSLRASKQNPNAATLVVEVTEKRFDWNARVDNRGTEARGPVQSIVGVSFNNLFGQHEAFSASWAATVQLDELAYFSGSYRQVLNSEGLTGFVSASHGYGKPGTATLQVLDYRTRSTTIEAGWAAPIVRQRERNLTLTGLAFISDSHSDTLGAPFNEDRLRGVRFRADADAAESGGAINQINFAFGQGISGLGSSENGQPLASRAVGRVDFSKVELGISRMQPLPKGFSAFLAAYGQYAFTSLLAPEQCGYGGGRFGRAFDPSQILGDHCWQALVEIRYDFPVNFATGLTAQLYNFADYGKVYTILPVAGTDDSQSAASVGSGVRFAWQEKVTSDFSLAKPLDGPRDAWRFYFAVSARN